MAWRIDAHVVRGEVDNRIRGRLVGRLWLVGRKEPVELELEGNASRDLAGRRLEFVNPNPQPGLDGAFCTQQNGVVGHFTASRKVRVPDVSTDELLEHYEQRKPFPWHWGNSVYFEWHSASNGRVVIESAEYQLKVSPDMTWEMSAEEEQQQAQINAQALLRFYEQRGLLSAQDEAAAAESLDFQGETFRADEDADETWRGDRPLSEEEADELIADSDRLADRLMAKLDEAGDSADLERILEEELKRRREESDTPPLTPEEEAERAAWLEELNRAAEEIASDPEFVADLERRHPLSERARNLTLRVMAEVDRGGWAPDCATGEHPIVDLVSSVTKAGGKLAGALDGRDWPPTIDECGLCIAWLKRARTFLEDGVVAGNFCLQQGLAPKGQLEAILRDLADLASEVDFVIDELRERLARGFD